MDKKIKVLGFRDHSELEEALDYIENYESEREILEEDSEFTSTEKEPKSGLVLFLSEMCGAIDLLKTISLSIEETQEPNIDSYFKEIYDVVSDEAPTYEGMMKILSKLENLGEKMKDSAPRKINSNPQIIKLKDESKDLKRMLADGKLETDDYEKRMDVLRKKAIAEVDPTETITLVQYSKAAESLFQAIKKFKAGAILELKNIEKSKNKEEILENSLSSIKKILSKKRKLVSTKDEVSNRLKQDKKDSEEIDKKRKEELSKAGKDLLK